MLKRLQKIIILFSLMVKRIERLKINYLFHYELLILMKLVTTNVKHMLRKIME